jgi:hypothetical protein
VKEGYKGNLQITGFDCRNFPVESSGLGAARNARSEIDPVSAIIIDDDGTRTRTVRVGNKCAGTEKHHLSRATQFFEFVKPIADFSTDGNTVRLPSALIQPMAADDIASAMAAIAVGPPVNGTAEIGGPEQFRLDDLVRRGLAAWQDPREVIADPKARYYGIAVSENTLVPGNDAQLGKTTFETWLTQSARKIPSAGSSAA